MIDAAPIRPSVRRRASNISSPGHLNNHLVELKPARAFLARVAPRRGPLERERRAQRSRSRVDVDVSSIGARATRRNKKNERVRVARPER